MLEFPSYNGYDDEFAPKELIEEYYKNLWKKENKMKTIKANKVGDIVELDRELWKVQSIEGDVARISKCGFILKDADGNDYRAFKGVSKGRPKKVLIDFDHVDLIVEDRKNAGL